VYPSGVWVRTATATGRAAYLEVLRGAVRAVVNGIEVRPQHRISIYNTIQYQSYTMLLWISGEG
jgi:hypothetical protein